MIFETELYCNVNSDDSDDRLLYISNVCNCKREASLRIFSDDHP